MKNNQLAAINDVEHLESLYPEDSRSKEIEQILSFVKKGESCQLIALPGVGRANLLGFLAFNHHVRANHLGETEQLSYHFVLANFSEVKNRPLLDIMKFLFLELTSSLHERRREEEFLVVDNMFKEALSYNDELVLFQGLKKTIDFLTLEKNLHVVFLLERFETYIPMVTSDFFTNLRSLRSHAKYKFSVVFSVTRPLEDMLEPLLLADYFEFIADHHVYLPLQDKSGLAFRVDYLEKLTGEQLSPALLEEILSLTAGHGKLTRLAMEYALATSVPNGYTKESLANLLLSQKTIQGALSEIWYFLTPDEQQDMLTLCKDETCPLPSQFLQRVGLISKEKIAIPLFEQFVKEKTKQLVSTGKIVFDSTTNTIKKDSLTLSDMLTISEFRLLRFLLDHPETIVEREHIIQAVWKDSKTYEGVSDQAVDQLIFRLRKKIEHDPNNPTHIQTVKGRGIRFTP